MYTLTLFECERLGPNSYRFGRQLAQYTCDTDAEFTRFAGEIIGTMSRIGKCALFLDIPGRKGYHVATA